MDTLLRQVPGRWCYCVHNLAQFGRQYPSHVSRWFQKCLVRRKMSVGERESANQISSKFIVRLDTKSLRCEDIKWHKERGLRRTEGHGGFQVLAWHEVNRGWIARSNPWQALMMRHQERRIPLSLARPCLVQQASHSPSQNLGPSPFFPVSRGIHSGSCIYREKHIHTNIDPRQDSEALLVGLVYLPFYKYRLEAIRTRALGLLF